MAPDPKRLRELTTPDWTPHRQRAVWHALERSAERRARRNRTLGVMSGVAVVAAALLLWLPQSGEEVVRVAEPGLVQAVPIVVPEAPTAVPARPPPLNFRDGTQVRLHDAEGEVVIASAEADEARVLLRRGGARFDVVPNPSRRFVVDVGLVTVEVLGTEFDLVREGDRVHVDVVRGSVAVSWPGERRVLSKGERGVFPPSIVDEPSVSEPDEPPESTDGPAKRPKQDVEAMLSAADAARRSGRPERALSILRRVLKEHPRDSRAPLAAFTMGRIELDRRHYKAAARQFAKVRTMGKSSLAEHALAREIEAWKGAGNTAKARARAEEYLRKHPKGPRTTQAERVLRGGP